MSKVTHRPSCEAHEDLPCANRGINRVIGGWHRSGCKTRGKKSLTAFRLAITTDGSVGHNPLWLINLGWGDYG